MAGIRQQQISDDRHRRPGRQHNGGIIGTGTPIANNGRIAGGAPGIANPQVMGTFAPIVFGSVIGSTPGGLVDRKQQIDPRMTVYSHPFGGVRYLSISSQQILPSLTHWNGFVTHQSNTPGNQPTERGTFFQRKHTPAVKTQFGAHTTGVPPDTAFQRQPRVMQSHPLVRSIRPTEKISSQFHPPSFESFNRLVYDATHFNSMYGNAGRWGNLKRSANHQEPVNHETNVRSSLSRVPQIERYDRKWGKTS